MSQIHTTIDSRELRQRMQAIRNELPKDVQQAREEVNNLTDWKYYVRSYPQFVLPIVALATYSLVPKSHSASTNTTSHPMPEGEKQPDEQSYDSQQSSLVAGLASAALTLATRSVLNVATKYGSDYLARCFSPSNDEPLHNEQSTPHESFSPSASAFRHGATR